MKLSHYLAVLVVIAGLSIWVVGLHVERVRSGHRIHRLELEREALLRERKQLRLEFEKEATPEKLRERAARMGLDETAGATSGASNGRRS